MDPGHTCPSCGSTLSDTTPAAWRQIARGCDHFGAARSCKRTPADGWSITTNPAPRLANRHKKRLRRQMRWTWQAPKAAAATPQPVCPSGSHPRLPDLGHGNQTIAIMIRRSGRAAGSGDIGRRAANARVICERLCTIESIESCSSWACDVLLWQLAPAKASCQGEAAVPSCPRSHPCHYCTAVQRCGA